MWAPCGPEGNAQIPSVRYVQFGRPAPVRSQASPRHFYPGTRQHFWIVAANQVKQVEKCGTVAIFQIIVETTLSVSQDHIASQHGRHIVLFEEPSLRLQHSV